MFGKTRVLLANSAKDPAAMFVEVCGKDIINTHGSSTFFCSRDHDSFNLRSEKKPERSSYNDTPTRLAQRPRPISLSEHRNATPPTQLRHSTKPCYSPARRNASGTPSSCSLPSCTLAHHTLLIGCDCEQDQHWAQKQGWAWGQGG